MKPLIILIIISLTISIGTGYAKKVAVLPELNRPCKIIINNDLLLIGDETVKVHVYSMKNYKYKMQLAKRGEGPREIFSVPWIVVNSKLISLFSNSKCVLFERSGKYIREFRVPTIAMNQLSPIGSNFLYRANSYKDGEYCYDLSIYSQNSDDKLKYKKLIYYYTLPEKKAKNNKKSYNLYPEFFDLIVFDDKAFIGDNSRGLYAEIYDEEGNQLSEIKLLTEPVKIPQERIDHFIGQLKHYGRWDWFKSQYYLDFPEHYPSFHQFLVDKNRIYFLLYKKKDGKREIVITDWKGKFIKRSYVPWVDYGRYVLNAVQDGKYYYLEENEDEEEWELHMEEIK
jgi:hypothetical protein